MGLIDCKKCINSACCKLVVELTKEDIKRLESLGYGENIKTNTDIFFSKFQDFKGDKKHIENLYNEAYKTTKTAGILSKGGNGFCSLLDNKTKLCTIYSDRPDCCKKYSIGRCKNIRLIKL
jgi:Fe-S-cluster containining protein